MQRRHDQIIDLLEEQFGRSIPEAKNPMEPENEQVLELL